MSDKPNVSDVLKEVLRVFDGARMVMTKRKCKLCKADIVFVMGPKGKTMVFDAKPQVAWYINEQEGKALSYKAYTPHWVTCPHADEFRKKRKKNEER